MPARRRNRYEFEHPDEDVPLPSGLPLPVVNANVFNPPLPAAHIQHIDNENNKMLEEALKASLEGYGLEEAKEESQQTAGDELFNQVLEQLPYLKPTARQTLHLITGLDDIISHEKNLPSPSNVTEVQRIQQSLQKALDTGEAPPVEDTNAALSFIAGYDMDDIKGAVYPRLESEILRLQVEEAEAEADDENEQIRQALEDSILEEALYKAKQEAETKEKAEMEAKEKQDAEKTVGGYNPQTPAERRAARLAALDRLESAAKAKTVNL
jgi:hypothetical protein